MKIPRYWAKAEKEVQTRTGATIAAQKWHWSDDSEADARRKAEERLELMLARIHAGEPWPRRYDYGEEVPLREELVREVPLPDGTEAAITRNAYGAEVLNVDNVMFVDIDTENPDDEAGRTNRTPRGGGAAGEPAMFSLQWFINLALEKLFGQKPSSGQSQGPAPPPAADTANFPAGLQHVERWVAQHPGWVFRAYETKSGYRLLAMHNVFQPDAAETLSVLRELNCDPVYVRLCKNQKSFRARLTPKPWRLGTFHGWRRITSHTHRFPYSDAAKSDLQNWLANYATASRNYSSCRYLKTIGSGSAHATAEAVARVHDQVSKAESGLPLA